ncbi:energy transducer TonB [Sphingomonas sp. GB1N7]|uniref:energy transducer TonB n=1 Tax=Parasphingomonas caseinilytica TaxID=3096158 RepID=UPI002FC5C862
MYADRYGKTGIKPGALSVAIGLNGAVLAALIFSAPELIKRPDPTPFKIINIPIPVPPPPKPVEKQITPKIERQIVDPPPLERPVTTDPIAPTRTEYTPTGPTGLEGGVTGGTGSVTPPYVPPHQPVTIGAKVDPRYARFLQPDYPPGERRMGREGQVMVRVLVGIDGRVKQVEQFSAASAAFFDVTKRQALEKWRFKPATRDGVPQEDWRTMTVTFVLNESD